MRIVQKFLPGVLAVAALAACDIPDDGYAELSGDILIPTEHLALVVQPSDDESDCDPEAEKGWDEFVAIGDTVPTVYVGLYPRPVDPTDGGDEESGEDNWNQGCGEIDHDETPSTPPEARTWSCPIGGTTARYAGTGSDGARFEFDALQLEKGDFYLIAWLDNRCRPDNSASNSLVWDISGPPGPLDADGDPDDDAYDLVSNSAAQPVSIGGGDNSLDDVLVLGTSLDV